VADVSNSPEQRPTIAAMSNPHDCLKWWRIAACGALLAAGCTTVANPISCVDGFCHDPALQFCDVDGTIGGRPLTCIAVDCTPLEFEACRGDEAVVCNATGDDYDVTHCAGGCSAELGGCKPTHIIPKYLPTVCDQRAVEPALTISESMTLDATAADICNGGLIEQTSEGSLVGPRICVLRYGTIRISTNKTLKVTGYHAIALVADDSLSVDGVLDVSADGTKSGPGGGGLSDGTPRNAFWPAALGGAGFKTAGGPGGNSEIDGGALNGGIAVSDPALMVPLRGGTYPWALWSGGVFSARGGGAGGAATLISCRDTVSVAGVIDAGGGGGQGGVGVGPGEGVLANGGGSGGYVALQGMNVSITGQLYANGGGGGAGSHVEGVEAASGMDGYRSDTISAQGGANPHGEGAGGAGGHGGVAPGPGTKPTINGFGAGAGGGSTGFFQTYTPSDVVPILTPAAASPALQWNRTVEAR
jgi:hypothetical protein